MPRRISTSRRQLQRCFDKHGEVSFRRCLVQIRLRRAAELLVETSLPVREVAACVGYSQPAQFTKAFARAYAVTASCYRAGRTGPAEPAPPPPGPASVC